MNNPRVTDIIKRSAEVLWEIQRKAEGVKIASHNTRGGMKREDYRPDYLERCRMLPTL